MKGRDYLSWAAEARINLNGNKRAAAVCAIYAASAASVAGLGVEACPFTGAFEARLAGEWFNYFRIKAEARQVQVNVSRPAFTQRPTASAVPPQTKPAPARPSNIVTTSAAYADQLGIETTEEGRA